MPIIFELGSRTIRVTGVGFLANDESLTLPEMKIVASSAYAGRFVFTDIGGSWLPSAANAPVIPYERIHAVKRKIDAGPAIFM